MAKNVQVDFDCIFISAMGPGTIDLGGGTEENGGMKDCGGP